MKALFIQLMLDRGFLASNLFYAMYAHTDEHVESYSAQEVTTMKVSKNSDGSIPYPDGVGAGPGNIYLPKNSVR